MTGLHASISIHICDDYLDQTTGLWSPNLQCFITRVAQHPERLENVYFTYVLLLRALAVSGPEILATLDAVTTSAAQSSTAREGDEQLARDDTREKLVGLVEAAKGCENTFDETSMFTGRDAEVRFHLSPFSFIILIPSLLDFSRRFRSLTFVHESRRRS